VPAIGLSGEDGRLLTADPLDPQRYGHVGTPSGVNTELLQQLLSTGYLPVLSPVSRSTDRAMGATLNVNGDDAAAAIAAAIGAEELLLVSDVAGVLLDAQPVVSLGPEDAYRLIEDGTARGGMAAKLQAALSALDGGVHRVRISDIAAIADATRGTVLTRAGSMCA
jgi:acetylglutamate kinase